jgi:hypothetical protein
MTIQAAGYGVGRMFDSGPMTKADVHAYVNDDGLMGSVESFIAKNRRVLEPDDPNADTPAPRHIIKQLRIVVDAMEHVFRDRMKASYGTLLGELHNQDAAYHRALDADDATAAHNAKVRREQVRISIRRNYHKSYWENEGGVSDRAAKKAKPVRDLATLNENDANAEAKRLLSGGE